MKKIRENTAGIDIGSREVYVSVEDKPVKSFFTFTSDFKDCVAYLKECNIETVAMEATGVYWVILYKMLEEAGIDTWLVDGRQTKQVPGRKTDVKDCQWIRELHSYGLLNRCFVAPEDILELRSYVRLREDHIRSSSMHVNHMQKALIEMNVRLPEVLSQVHGSSGMAMIEAIIAGERDPEKLVALCHTHILKKKREEVLKALEGRYSQAGIFSLTQAVNAYKFYQQQMGECDKMIEQVLKKINLKKELQKPKEKRKDIRHNKPNIDKLDSYLFTAFDFKDANTLPALTDYSWMQLYAELGSDLTRWPTEKHFTSWLCLAPSRSRSGKMNKRARKKGAPPAATIFRQLAQSLIQSKKIALGAYGRRLRAKKGPGVAIKAMARKLAVLYWRVMVKGLDYVEKGVLDYQEKQRINKERTLKRLAKEFNATVVFQQA